MTLTYKDVGPCPFPPCRYAKGVTTDAYHDRCRAHCECGAAGPWRKTTHEAILAWNQRSGIDPNAIIRERALKKLTLEEKGALRNYAFTDDSAAHKDGRRLSFILSCANGTLLLAILWYALFIVRSG